MRKSVCVLPKNKGIPLLYWRGKSPLYTISKGFSWERSSWGISKDSLLYLLNLHEMKIPFIFKRFPPIAEKEIDSCLQLMYETLMLFHGLLAPRGVMWLSADWVTRDYLQILVSEVFGEEDLRVSYIEENGF